jgi:hypothetical protein
VHVFSVPGRLFYSGGAETSLCAEEWNHAVESSRNLSICKAIAVSERNQAMILHRLRPEK